MDNASAHHSFLWVISAGNNMNKLMLPDLDLKTGAYRNPRQDPL
jgi:hypothetical protein